MDEHNRQSHLEDGIPTNLKCEVLDEHQDDGDDDDVAARSWRFHWRVSMKQNKLEEKQIHGYVIADEHSFEDKTLVYVWMACQSEKVEERFR